jgi:hypothetical protein
MLIMMRLGICELGSKIKGRLRRIPLVVCFSSHSHNNSSLFFISLIKAKLFSLVSLS